MLVTIGKVRQGAIEIDTPSLREGATVTILAAEGDETFELNADDEASLLAAIKEADRGETVEAEEIRAQIKRQ